MLDYETLRLIWWLLIGIILVAFMVTDGFDMGVGCLLPLIARNDDERRVLINSVGAHWEGNQVWLILAGGALFAAWPRVYAAAFSGFYPCQFHVVGYATESLQCQEGCSSEPHEDCAAKLPRALCRQPA